MLERKPPLVQEIGCQTRAATKMNPASIKCVVAVSQRLWMEPGNQLRWMYRHQIEIEQRVQVGPQKQSVAGIIVLAAPVRPDMRRFHNGQKSAARDHACRTVDAHQGIAEATLPAAHSHLAQDSVPSIRHVRNE